MIKIVLGNAVQTDLGIEPRTEKGNNIQVVPLKIYSIYINVSGVFFLNEILIITLHLTPNNLYCIHNFLISLKIYRLVKVENYITRHPVQLQF